MHVKNVLKTLCLSQTKSDNTFCILLGFFIRLLSFRSIYLTVICQRKTESQKTGGSVQVSIIIIIVLGDITLITVKLETVTAEIIPQYKFSFI